MVKTLHYMGLDPPVIFYGVVENRMDPLNVGRCQVRIYSWNDHNKTFLPTSALPWAQILIPLNDPNTRVKPPREGTTVVGYFMDGSACQFPVIIGTLPGIPDTQVPTQQGFSDARTSAQLATAPAPPQSVTYNTTGSGATVTDQPASQYPPLNTPYTSNIAINEDIASTAIGQKQNSTLTNIPTVNGGNYAEPPTPYNAKYPYDDVYESESGHVIEVDDTPGAERLHRFHRTGTFEEIGPTGQRVLKVVNNNYEIVMADDNIYIMGGENITVQGGRNVLVQGNETVQIQQNRNVSIQGNETISIIGNQTITVGGDMQFNVTGSFSLSADGITFTDTSGTKSVMSDGTMAVTGEINSTGDQIAGSGNQNISQLNHKHNGVQSGGGETAPPVPGT